MAEPLKNQFGADVPRTIAAMVKAVYPAFDSAAFVRTAVDGYDALEVMQRGQKIAQALHQHLPQDYPHAAGILMDSLHQAHDRDTGRSLSSFLYLPHTQFVATYGLAHFEKYVVLVNSVTGYKNHQHLPTDSPDEPVLKAPCAVRWNVRRSWSTSSPSPTPPTAASWAWRRWRAGSTRHAA